MAPKAASTWCPAQWLATRLLELLLAPGLHRLYWGAHPLGFFWAAPLRRRRDEENVTGPLTLASAACPALRELEVESWYLDQPTGPLPHLTRLHMAEIFEPP